MCEIQFPSCYISSCVIIPSIQYLRRNNLFYFTSNSNKELHSTDYKFVLKGYSMILKFSQNAYFQIFNCFCTAVCELYIMYMFLQLRFRFYFVLFRFFVFVFCLIVCFCLLVCINASYYYYFVSGNLFNFLFNHTGCGGEILFQSHEQVASAPGYIWLVLTAHPCCYVVFFYL